MESDYQKEVSIPAGKISLRGELVIPAGAKSIVIFSHGSGSSRFSMRNKQVAKGLHLKNIGTLLFDLLTEAEDIYYRNRFDINLLTDRLVTATRWLEVLPNAKDCVIGYFGASTGAASALKAAANMHEIGAVVSRGGRPDLAREDLSKVKSPTLLIVGSLDPEVIQLNKDAFAQLKCEKKLTVIEGATHLFEESGKMEIVSVLAANWFENYLTSVEV
jgi:predicted alpha/beta-hydrolase family hydrolase